MDNTRCPAVIEFNCFVWLFSFLLWRNGGRSRMKGILIKGEFWKMACWRENQGCDQNRDVLRLVSFETVDCIFWVSPYTAGETSWRIFGICHVVMMYENLGRSHFLGHHAETHQKSANPLTIETWTTVTPNFRPFHCKVGIAISGEPIK